MVTMDISPLSLLAARSAVTLASQAIDSVADVGHSFLQSLGMAAGPSTAGAELTGAPAGVSQAGLQQLVEQFQRQANLQLAAAGVDKTRQFQFSSGPAQRIQLDSQHPDRALIEQVLSTDPQLSQLFQEIISAARQLRLADNPEDLVLTLDGVDARLQSTAPLSSRFGGIEIQS